MSRQPTTEYPPEPFGPEAAQLSGCGKPAVVGCLVLLVVVGVGLGMLTWKARDLLVYAVGEYRVAVFESLPEDISVEERQRLDAAFDGAIATIESGDLDAAALQGLQGALASPPRPGEVLDRKDVLELTRALEAVAGIEPAGGTGIGEVSGLKVEDLVPLVARDMPA
jgi:hypothetical protein